MEQIKNLAIRAVTEISKSSTESLTPLQNNEISLYRGEGITTENAKKQTARLLHAFPELTNGAIGVILERAKEKGFTDQRLTDAVNNVIDNCVYPRPKPADFLTFDKRVKVFSYAEACAEVGRSVGTLLEFTRILINGKGFFIRNSDKELYNIPNEM